MKAQEQGLKICNFCGEEISESQRRCPYCGSLLDMGNIINNHTSAQINYNTQENQQLNGEQMSDSTDAGEVQDNQVQDYQVQKNQIQDNQVQDNHIEDDLKQFNMEGLPDSLVESAQIDGCTHFGIFLKIILPLSKAIIAVLALFLAVDQWNGYFTALIYLNREELLPVQILLQRILINFQMNSVMEGQIKLFYNQVYVADNIKEVIPEFLMLLKGMIDCPDLPLNVSRSFLQNDGYVKKISTHITKKVADKLTSLFENERETYNKYWDDINPFVKYGCIKEPKFHDI